MKNFNMGVHKGGGNLLKIESLRRDTKFFARKGG